MANEQQLVAHLRELANGLVVLQLTNSALDVSLAADTIERLQAERDAQVREAFMAGFDAGLLRGVEKKHAPAMPEAIAAYLATRERPTGPEAGK